MFRGFTIREARIIAALVLAVLGGLTFLSWRGEEEAAAAPLIEGNVVKHVAGELVTDEPGAIIELPIAGVIDLNAADPKDLEALPGIGPAKAGAIAAQREVLGGFANIDELLAVHGIGEKTLARLRPFVTVSQPRIDSAPNESAAAPRSEFAEPAQQSGSLPVRINVAGLEELQRLSGVGPKLAERILLDRQLNGPFQVPGDLQRVKGIGPKTVQKNLEMVSCQ